MEEDRCSNPRKKMITEPLLMSQKEKSGFRTLPFIIVEILDAANEAFERVASFGLMPNMVLYLTREYGLRSSTAANAIFFWSAATDFFPMIGAFLADSYLGRYWTIGFGCIASLMGMVLLWLTSIFPQARPLSCLDSISCKLPPSLPQLTLLGSSFAMISVGAGGIRSSSMAFGAEQLDSSGLDKFFQWYYVSVLTSIIASVTVIVYIQEQLGWLVGFGVPVLLMFSSAICFFSAAGFYVKMEVKSSLVTRFAQVLVASYRNRSIDLPSEPESGSFYCKKGSMVREPSPKLRFLNKACYIPPETNQLLPTDSNPPNTWRLCTIDQVEELKSLINILPLWSTGIVTAIACFQSSFLVLQASTMDRHLTRSFEIPAGSFTLFSIVSVLLLFPLYSKVIIPFLSKITGEPGELTLTLIQRMGIGIVLSVVATFAVAIVEFFRRQRTLSNGPPVSAMWLVPYFVLVGFSQGFSVIAQNEFYYTQLPKTMSSVATSLYGLGTSVGSLGSSFLVCGIDFGTKIGGKESWVSSDINKGHYDYYYWVISCFSLVNFGYFLACCRAYEPIIGDQEGDVSNKEDGEEVTV